MTICPSCGHQTSTQASAAFSVDDTVLECCNRAYDVAEIHGSKEVQLVHFMYAIALCRGAQTALAQFGLSVEKLSRSLASGFAQQSSGSHTAGPRVSDELNILMRHAGREAGRNTHDTVKVEDILATLLQAGDDLPGIVFIRQCLEQSRTQQSHAEHETTFRAPDHYAADQTAPTQTHSPSCQQTLSRLTERLNAQESLLKAITEQLIQATARTNTNSHSEYHHSEHGHATLTSRTNTADAARSGSRQSRNAASSNANSTRASHTFSERDSTSANVHDADRDEPLGTHASGHASATSNGSRAHQSRSNRSDGAGRGNHDGHGNGHGNGKNHANGHGGGYGSGYGRASAGGQSSGYGRGYGNGSGHGGSSGEASANRSRTRAGSWIKRTRAKVKARYNSSGSSTNSHDHANKHRHGYGDGQGSSNRRGAHTSSSERSAWGEREPRSRDRVTSQNDNDYDMDRGRERNTRTRSNVSERRTQETRTREPETREKRFYLALGDDIVDAPSIGQKTAARLIPEGIQTIRDLLDCNPDDLADRLDYRHIPSHRIEAWQKQARLVCIIPWLRGTHAQFLVGAGFDTIPKILKADRDDICAAILSFATTRDGQSILRSGPPPQVERILSWIDHTELAEPDRAA